MNAISPSNATWNAADEEALQRAVLELLGLKRLTDNVKSRLAAVRVLQS